MTGDRTEELRTALTALRERVAGAVAAAGRQPGEVQLLAVTKFFPATDVVALHELGCRAFGESRVQEATAKIAEVDAVLDPPPAWHMVGRIQRNKAAAVARWADTVHSVDSPRVLAALGRGAVAALDDGVRARPLQVFVQLSLDGDPERGGVDVGDATAVDRLCAAAGDTAGLTFAGLMAIPPVGADPAEAFARLAAERDRVQDGRAPRLGISAGMSGDLEAAIRHGSTCVRVGTALLGSRPLASPAEVTPVTSSSQTTPTTG